MGTKAKCDSATSGLSTDLKIAGAAITLSPFVKLLGVTFDRSLSFDAHISAVCVSVNFHLRALAHIRKFLSVSSANLLASSIIASRLDYCNAMFAELSHHNILHLQRLQNRAARIVW